MNNYRNYNQLQNFQSYQPMQYFPQPQGYIYMLDNANDINNMPVGTGISAGIYLSEGILYLKMNQNGSPMQLAYRLNPLESINGNSQLLFQGVNNETSQVQTQTPIQEQNIEQRILAVLESFDVRLKNLEQSRESSKGGNKEWPL